MYSICIISEADDLSALGQVMRHDFTILTRKFVDAFKILLKFFIIITIYICYLIKRFLYSICII